MAQVPVTQGPRVQQAGIPGVRVNNDAPLESFGGGAGNAEVFKSIGNVGLEASKVYEEEKKKADDSATTEYYAKLAQKKQQLFWDPKSGVMTQKGSNSFTAPETYGKQFDDYADELEKSLSGTQIAMAKKIRMKEKLEFDGQILHHVSQESDKYQDETVKSGIMAARNDAILNYNNPGAVDDKIRLQESIYHQTATGKPAALVEVEMKDIRSKTHFAVIDRMLDNGSDIQAKQYFEKVKDQLTGPDVDTVEKNLKAGTLAGESQRTSDQIFNSSRTMEDALTKALAIQDPKLRDETERRVKDRFAMKQLAIKNQEEQNSKSAGNIIDQTGNTDNIPRSVWNTFSVSDKSSLEAYAKHKREGTQPVTDWNQYYNLKTMASSPEMRSEYQRINLMKYRSNLADAEFKELVNAQEGLRKGDDKTAKLLDGVRTDAEIVNNALKQAGVDPNSKDETEATQINSFRRQVDEKVIAVQQASGKKINSVELQKITDSLIVEGVTSKGWLWDTKKRKFELNPGEKLQFRLGDIPAQEKALIEQTLQRRGIPVTDDKILELYSRKAGAP